MARSWREHLPGRGAVKVPAGAGGQSMGRWSETNGSVARPAPAGEHRTRTDSARTPDRTGTNDRPTHPTCTGNTCPDAPECMVQWLNPDPDTGATCAHCYQVLPRFVLARIIEGRSA